MNDQKRVVLVTGVAGYWGSRVARRLLAEPNLRVLGVDRRAPERIEPGLDFVKADVRNPLLVELLRAEGVDAVVHLAFRQRQWRREQDFESNVLGATHLIGACADAAVGQVVLKSTMALYGARPDNPMYVAEDWPLRAQSAYGHVRDALDIEMFAQEFCVEYPELRLAILRFPNIIGPDVDTPLTRLLRLPLIPCLLGFDPLLQVIDAEDAVEALAQAVLTGAHGPFNVAAAGIMPFGKLVGMTGRLPLPIFHLALYQAWQAAVGLPGSRKMLRWFPIEPDYLRFPWTGDLTRMRAALGFKPQHSAAQAVGRYAQALRVQRYQHPAEERRFAADRLQEVVAARRQDVAEDGAVRHG